MPSIDEIKQKKLEELRNRAGNQAQNQKISEEGLSRLQKEIDEIEEIVKRRFTKEAHERYCNLRSAHPEKALKLITVLAQIIGSGSLQAQITDEQMKKLLSKISPNKDFTITRR